MSVTVEIFARNLEVTENIRDFVTKKASKLDRYLNEIENVKVDIAHNKSARSAKDRYVAQLTVRGRKAILRTEERSDDILTAFDSALDKMQRKMEKYKGKRQRGRGDGRTAADVVPMKEDVPSEEEIIVRKKSFDLIPMNAAEALEQMQLLGHENFFVFYNAETNSINILYRRRDKNYGLIEPKIR